MGNYADHYRRAVDTPEAFWLEAAQALDWAHAPTRGLDADNAPFYRWFPDGRLNTCYNALDRHVAAGRGQQTAIVYDSPVTSTRSEISYAALTEQVARFAGALCEAGVETGDRVVIYMPMVPEALIAMLACARIGAIHSVVFGGFAAAELAARIDDATPKLIVSASCGVEPGRVVAYKPLLDAALALCSHQPEHCIILQRPQLEAEMAPGRDLDWVQATEAAHLADCVPVAASHPLYILYTSGTTGRPKGVVRDNGGHAVAMHWSMRHIYNVAPGDVFWSASDVGWVVGHSYICYGPLLYGCTTVIYEGKPIGTPDAGAFWRVVEQYRVKVLFTAPTALRAIKCVDPEGTLAKDYDLSSLSALFLAGERSDPASLEWASRTLQVPVIDHWWQTETGWAITANCLGIEARPEKFGSAYQPVPGYNLTVLDEQGQTAAPEAMGKLALKLPLPPGSLLTLWQRDTDFLQSYLAEHDGYYMTWDAGFVDPDGDVWVMSRLGDVINVAGHRLSTGDMEEVLARHPDVGECAVIGVRDPVKGQCPLGLVVVRAGSGISEQTLRDELQALVRQQIGPVAAYRHSLCVKRLPKTRSGKILRGTIRSIADGLAYRVPATIDDPAVIDEITEALRHAGFPRDDEEACG